MSTPIIEHLLPQALIKCGLCHRGGRKSLQIVALIKINHDHLKKLLVNNGVAVSISQL